MIESNNRISSTGSGYGSGQSTSKSTTGAGPSDFEKLLRQQHAQQQIRKAQQSTEAPPGLDPHPPVNFSKHALQRLEKRQIDLDPAQNQRLDSAIQAAATKGARQSLVFMDGIAFVVNVQERRVITALNVDPHDNSTVFTNIDSAVLA